MIVLEFIVFNGLFNELSDWLKGRIQLLQFLVQKGYKMINWIYEFVTFLLFETIKKKKKKEMQEEKSALIALNELQFGNIFSFSSSSLYNSISYWLIDFHLKVKDS